MKAALKREPLHRIAEPQHFEQVGPLVWIGMHFVELNEPLIDSTAAPDEILGKIVIVCGLGRRLVFKWIRITIAIARAVVRNLI